MAIGERREEDARALTEERSAVRLVRQDLDRLFEASRRLVAGIALARSDTEICSSLLRSAGAYPEFLNLALLEVQREKGEARAVCAAVMPAYPHTIVLTPEERRLVDELSHPGDIAVAPIRGSPVDGRPLIPVAGFAGDRANGARRFVAASLDLAWLSREVARIPLPDKAILLVLDRHGTVAARNPPSVAFAVGTPAPDFERTLPGRGDFEGEIVGEGGISRYYSLMGVGATDGLVVVMKRRSLDVFDTSGGT